MEKWVSDTSRRCGSRFDASQLRSALYDKDMTDKQLESMAFSAYNSLQKPVQQKFDDDSWMHMRIVQYADGVVECLDPNSGHLYAKLIPHKDGMTFMGPAKFLAKLGGRGEISQLVTMMEDGDYLHTLKSK